MTKFYMRWKLNPTLIPANLEERLKLWISMHKTVRTDLKADAISDWGIYDEASAGYSFVEGDEESVYETLKKLIPYVIFDIKPIPQL